MLNGKFFAGLPPKMMERNAGAPNRLESHLFWPDDSRAEPVQQHKRRGSLQAESSQWSRDGGGGFQRQASLGDRASEVDTKQRFKKEFANSSIQFYDNIQEEEIDSRRQAIRKPLIRQALKQDIAIKPTAMKLLPSSNDDAQEEYAAIKKKQAFDSKIEFYDYADGSERPNNRRMSKMDVNDKKDVERNTKNSPKLQVKGIVRNLHVLDERQRNNDRNDRERDRRSHNDYAEEDEEPQQQKRERLFTPRFIRNEVQGRIVEDSGGRNNNNSQRHNEQALRADRHRDDDVTERPLNAEDGLRGGQQTGPKRILKNPMNRDEGDFYDHYVDYVERGTQNMHIHQPSPKKHVTYDDDERRVEHNGAFDYDDFGDGRIHRRENMESHSQNDIKLRNRSTNGSQQSPQRQQQHQQQKGRKITSDYANDDTNNEERRHGNDRSTENSTSRKSLNLSKNNNNNNNNNHNQNDAKPNNQSQHQQQIRQRQGQRQQQREITPKISASPMPSASASGSDDANPTSLSSNTMDFQKHLRSSLCFSGGEIVASAESTPTSESGSRRTARSAATSRRVCVGLPD